MTDLPLSGASLMRRAALASLVVSVMLVLLKAAAFLVTGSVAMLAALADSALDVFTSAINLVAVREALRPADAEHRFGHGKAEPLAGLAQGAFIAGSATFLVVAAVNRFIAPQAVEHGALGIAVMVVSIAAAGSLVLFQRMVVAHTRSVAIGADRKHYFGDVITNLGVIAAIVLATQFASDPGRSDRGAGRGRVPRLERMDGVPPMLRPVDGPRTARQ